METHNKRAKRIHAANVAKGFYDDISNGEVRNIYEMLSLIVTEYSEAIEAHRKNKFADVIVYNEKLALTTEYVEDSFYPTYDEAHKKGMDLVAFRDFIKDTFEDELADAVIRIYDLAGHYDLDLDTVMKLIEDAVPNVGGYPFMEDDVNMATKLYIPMQSCLTLGDKVDIENEDIKRLLNVALGSAILYTQALAEKEDIDLDWHIEEKLNYNASRKYRHGKQY